MLLVLLSVLVWPAGGSSEETVSYSCCPSPQIRFDPDCEHLWVVDGQTIALWRQNGEERRSIAPCKEIKDGLMKLDQCVNLNVTSTCINKQGLAAEQRISYHGEPCPTPITGNMAPGTQGRVPLLLAALILVLIR